MMLYNDYRRELYVIRVGSEIGLSRIVTVVISLIAPILYCVVWKSAFRSDKTQKG